MYAKNQFFSILVVNVTDAVTVRLKLKLSQLIDVVSRNAEILLIFKKTQPFLHNSKILKLFLHSSHLEKIPFILAYYLYVLLFYLVLQKAIKLEMGRDPT